MWFRKKKVFRELSRKIDVFILNDEGSPTSEQFDKRTDRLLDFPIRIFALKFSIRDTLLADNCH